MVTVQHADQSILEWLTQNDAVSKSWLSSAIDRKEILVAFENDAPIGFLRFSYFWGKLPYMDMIRVQQEKQKMGIGTKLYEKWEEDMRNKGYSTIMTSSELQETSPQIWHKRNGFYEAGVLSFGKFQTEKEIFLIKDI